MTEKQFLKFAEKQQKNLTEGESAVTVHSLEGGGVFITVVDEHSYQLIALTVQELEKLNSLLKKQFEG